MNTPGQNGIIQLVRIWAGASLHSRCEELKAFISRGIDDPQSMLNEHISDCGLFALAIWHAVGIKHPILSSPYQNGHAISNILVIASDKDAIKYPLQHGLPTAGALMHYYSHRPSLDDHVEFCLDDPNQKTGIAPHAGGGRQHCAIGLGTSDVHWNAGRPLQRWYDPLLLLPNHDNKEQ